MFDLNEYTTVAERIRIFRQMYPMGRVLTHLVFEDATRVVFRTELYRDDEDSRLFSTGYAREITTERGVNRDFALENCETSSIGVACKNADIGTEKKAISREEAAKVNRIKERDAMIQETKSKLKETASEYVPVAKEDDPWTIRAAEPAATVDEAVEMVKSIIGGTTDKDVQTCKHGEMVWKTGTSRTGGKPWGHWRCMNHILGEAERCEPIWYEIAKDGTWQPRIS